MDVQTTIALTSVLGMILFFGGGFLSGRKASSAEPAAPLPVGGPDAERAEQESAQLRQELARERAALQAERAETAELRSSAESAEARVRDAAAQLAERTSAAKKREQELATLQQENERLREAAQAASRAAPPLASTMVMPQGDTTRLEADVAKLRAQLDQANAKVHQAATRATTAERAKVEGQRHTEQLERKAKELEKHLAEAQRQSAAQAKQLSQAEARAASAEKRADEAEEQASDGATLVREAQQAPADAATPLRRQLDTLRGQHDRLLSEKDALMDELATLRQSFELSSAPGSDVDVESLKRANRDAHVRAEMLEQRVKELEHYADENTRLTGIEAEAQSAKQRIAELEREAAARAAKAVPRVASRAAPSRPSVTPRSGAVAHHAGASVRPTVERGLERQLARYATASKLTSVVLADASGLTVAAHGDELHHAGVAALCGMALDFAQRIGDYVPFDVPGVVQVGDSRSLLRVRLFPCDDDTFALASLGPKSIRAIAEEDEIVSSFPSLLTTTVA